MGRIVVIILFILSTNIMRSQEDTREKFDFELYTKTRFGKLNFIRPNGNIVFVMSFSEKGGGLMEEIVNKYPFYTLYKEYYPDGYIEVQKT